MKSFIALLRGVNVGGTGKLAMSDLKSLCEEAGFEAVRTYIASGNVVFRSNLSESKIKATLEQKLSDFVGRPMTLMVRTAAELAKVAAENPFPNAPGNRVMAIFLNKAVPTDTLKTVTGQTDSEEVQLGKREIFVCYGEGMGHSRLRIPIVREGTARNMNTISKLAIMAQEI